MAKKKKELLVKTESYGLYAKWSNRCRELPLFLKFTDQLPLRVESEFGFILHIKNGKGLSVSYTVEHPPFKNEKGIKEPSFRGEIPIRDNDFKVYVGDTLWEPLCDKTGIWRVVAKINNTVYEDKKFIISQDVTIHKELIDMHAGNHLKNL